MRSDIFSRVWISCSGFRGLVGKTIFLAGLGIAALGLLMMLGVPFGRLPGDIVVRRGNFSFYFPVVTSLLLSILLTLIFALFRR